jgi:hypothetical protein
LADSRELVIRETDGPQTVFEVPTGGHAGDECEAVIQVFTTIDVVARDLRQSGLRERTLLRHR